MAQLPPGPKAPRTVQTVAWWKRSIPLFERCRARYGKRFTLRFLQSPDFVHLCDPAEAREVFTAPPEVLHPGEGAQILEPFVGANSVILLDERAHLSQRKLMLPAFHGERMAALTGLLEEVTEREVAGWPLHRPLELHTRLQALTLEVILRAVFGLDPGPRLDGLRDRLTGILDLGTRPTSMIPALQRGPRWRDFLRGREATDALLFELIDERREAGDGADRDEVLTMLLAARHEDGSPMSNQEVRDELMTLLVAGHETTASAFGWAVERGWG
jgi:cytochrome P450